MRKIQVLIAIIIVFVTVTVGCNSIEKDILVIEDDIIPVIKKTEELKDIISQYILKRVAYIGSGKGFEAHEIYEAQEKEDGLYIYMWVLAESYSLSGDDLVLGSGVSMPVVMIVKKDDKGNPYVSEHIEPIDGSMYMASIKETFPQKHHDRILSRTGNVQDLSEIIEMKARNHFGLENLKSIANLKAPTELNLLNIDADIKDTKTSLYKPQVIEYLYFKYLGEPLKNQNEYQVQYKSENENTAAIEITYGSPFNIIEFLDIRESSINFHCTKIIIPIDNSGRIWLLDHNYKGYVVSTEAKLDVDLVNLLIDDLKEN